MTRIDPGAVSLVELRGHERQAAEELGQWRTRVEERKPPDASPAAITLALLLTAGSGSKGPRAWRLDRRGAARWR